MRRALLYLAYILSFYLSVFAIGYLYFTFGAYEGRYFLGKTLDTVVMTAGTTLYSAGGFFVVVLATWKYSISKSDIIKFGVPYGIFSALLIAGPMAVFDFGPQTPEGGILLVIHIISAFVVVKLFYGKRQDA